MVPDTYSVYDGELVKGKKGKKMGGEGEKKEKNMG